MSDASRLFDEFAARSARGEKPDVLEYLERAGEHADELAGVLELFLAASSAPDPSEATTRMFSAWVESVSAEGPSNPLAILRNQLRLSQKSIVDRLSQRFGLEPSKRRKVARYYDELEAGMLERKRIDRRLIDFLSEMFQTDVAELLTLQSSRPLAAEAALMQQRPSRPSKPTSVERGSTGWDEVDELFLGGES